LVQTYALFTPAVPNRWSADHWWSARKFWWSVEKFGQYLQFLCLLYCFIIFILYILYIIYIHINKMERLWSLFYRCLYLLKKFMLVVRGIQNCEFSGPWGPNGWRPLLYTIRQHCIYNLHHRSQISLQTSPIYSAGFKIILFNVAIILNNLITSHKTAIIKMISKQTRRKRQRA
jgi:hypothetical protein